jgi:hypothetical protein
MKALQAGKLRLGGKACGLASRAQIDPLIALRDETGLVAAEAFMIISPHGRGRATVRTVRLVIFLRGRCLLQQS